VNSLNTKVDLYLADGCGRCKYYATDNCKVRNWTEELETLRQYVLECGLFEELKWGVPCYTFNQANITVVSAFKDYACLSFFKGALMNNDNGLLLAATENSQAARLIKFYNLSEIIESETIIKDYIFKAIEVEKLGLTIEYKKELDPIPEELQSKFVENIEFEKAFQKLTPGKQRAYIFYFSQPKNSTTKTARIEACLEKIMNGEGLHDKYIK
jgi:uncharacterized protein YdeI (YjbR/CyaY-like superfamily)